MAINKQLSFRELFLELRHHSKLHLKRHPMREANKFSRYMLNLGIVASASYLVFFGVLFGVGFSASSNLEPYYIMNKGLLIVFLIDFKLRFFYQQLPAQEITPYLTMPIKRESIIDCLLLRSGLSAQNIIWLFMFIPFSLIAIVPNHGLWGVITYCIGIVMISIFNNYWYILCRTLIKEHFLWVFLPLSVYLGLAALEFIPDGHMVSRASMIFGQGLLAGWFWTFLVLIGSIIGILFIVRHVISNIIFSQSDLSTKPEKAITKVRKYEFLEKYGLVGQYMQLEFKLILRNKATRSLLHMSFGFLVVFTLVSAFTTIYDGNMSYFIMVYNLSIVALFLCQNIMNFEGNYIDCLMTRHESILSLLQAKYYLYALATVIPWVFMQILVIQDKQPFFKLLSISIFCAGTLFFLMFQLAVYNKTTIPLNKKIGRNSGRGNNMVQTITTLCSTFIPMILIGVLYSFSPEYIANWVLSIIGITFIATSPYWLRNVYKRFMVKRYINMEGFRDSRESD